MKIINLLLLLVLINQPVFAQDQPNKTFTIAGQLTDNYEGYLFLEYEHKKDSCLIQDHRFSFKGKLNQQVVAATIYGKSSPSAIIYLENKPIQLAISYVIKKGKGILCLLMPFKELKRHYCKKKWMRLLK